MGVKCTEKNVTYHLNGPYDVLRSKTKGSNNTEKTSLAKRLRGRHYANGAELATTAEDPQFN